jgi:hypothetical protein
MACENEWGDVAAAGLAAAAACATVETIVGAIPCAAALWAYKRALDALNSCRVTNGLAMLDQYTNQIAAEAQYMQQLADSAQQTATA